MPTITIDDRRVTVPAGGTLLDAAEQLGIDVPTLCFLKGYEPSTSCQVCMVKDRRTEKLLPACATVAVDDMEIESETDELFQVRRTALELLFSDHTGDCLAPCFFACPAHMDIPLMLRQIGEHQGREAIATIKRDIALPAVLGRICSKPCEKGCRRAGADGPVAVCDLKRFVADEDLARNDPYRPACRLPSGKRVAIVGAGATGLAAAYELQQAGHACTLFDNRPKPGGRMRYETTPAELPRDILDKEIAQILRLGAELKPATTVGHAPSLETLVQTFDAVLVAWGRATPAQIEQSGLTASKRGLAVKGDTCETNHPAIFAAGTAVRGNALPIRSVADGKEAARAICQYLAGETIHVPSRPFSSRIGRVADNEFPEFLADAAAIDRHVPPAGADYRADEAADQAGRCLACGCLAHNHCKLERYAQIYAADPNRFAGRRPPHRVIGREASVLFDPGKCIKCELCVQIAACAGEPLGLTFVGRGFDVQLAVPFDRGLDEALAKTAADCVAACPTAALSFAQSRGPGVPDTVPLNLERPAPRSDR